MKYLKKYENNSIKNIKQKFKEIGWEYKYIEDEDGHEVSIQNEHIDLVSVDYNNNSFSFDFTEYNYFVLTDFEKLAKIVKDVEKFCEIYEKAKILDDNAIIDLDYPYVKYIEEWNRDVSEIIEEYDYLFSGKDMGLL